VIWQYLPAFAINKMIYVYVVANDGSQGWSPICKTPKDSRSCSIAIVCRANNERGQSTKEQADAVSQEGHPGGKTPYFEPL
jgi:hypothetical protein